MKSLEPHGPADFARGTRIQSVARGCGLLLWLSERAEGATAKEIAFANGLALATTYHLLNTLADHGLLEKDAQRRYVIGPAVARLALARLHGPAVDERLLSALRELAARTRAPAYLVDWGEHELRLLASVEGADVLRVTEAVQAPLRDAHARASGKLLLAYAPRLRDAYLDQHPPRRLTRTTLCDRGALDDELARIRTQGWAQDAEELADGVACVAAPLVADGEVVAAFGVSVPAERFARVREQLTDTLLGVVQEAAAGAFDRALAPR